MLDRLDSRTADYRPGIRKLGNVVLKLRTIRKAVIASIHGAAAGAGFNLALGWDFRIAAEDTKFVFAFVNIGLIPDAGGPLALVRIMGVAKATELLMTGKLFTAKEALEWGLVNEVTTSDQLEAATLKLATKWLTDRRSAMATSNR
jgi:enoyl-CoA hydratase/carnithine racemase